MNARAHGPKTAKKNGALALGCLPLGLVSLCTLLPLPKASILLSRSLRPLCIMSLFLISLSSLPETFSLRSLRYPLFVKFFCLFPTLACLERGAV
jgi:hypothetical protein